MKKAMRKNILGRNIRRTILRSLGRYLAIVGIIALGAGMFVGLLSTKSDMIATAQDYLDEQNMFDLRLLSSYGWTAEDVQKIAALSGVVDAEGAISVDAFARLGDTEETTVYRMYAIPEIVSKVYLLEGRMPEKANECLLDGNHMDSSVIGTQFTVSDDNDSDTLDSFTERTFTVVGLVNSPLHMDVFRGNTTLGSGNLTGFAYLMPQVFTLDYYTEIGLTMAGEYEVYTEAFDRAMEQMAEEIKSDVTQIAQNRFLALKAEPQAELNKGSAEYRDAVAKFEQARQETLEELDRALAELEAGQAQWEDSWAALLENEALLEQARQALAQYEAVLPPDDPQLLAQRQMIEQQAAQLAQGRLALEQAKTELDRSLEEYYDGKIKAEEELSKAEGELAEAKAELENAQKQLDEMAPAEVYILDRNTNQGYVALNSNSDIVAGVSRVFPAFFLLVAAMVCITTMTRMVDEERTQIGILKALGYSNGAIIGKYLVYSGSAALVGCGFGTVIGSVVFPVILWEAYKIILNVRPDVVLELNWPLCLAVVAAYTAVSSLVTWYCCRRELREVPAELIRPRAPQAGKKILLEHLPFWNKISFLNKVMFRNVFRYRQRLLMMLLGICGCTALLLTGFGIRDSIMHIVDNQFESITVYDMEVYFTDGQTPQEQAAFREGLGNDASSVHFFHQSGMDIEYNGQNREVYTIISDERVKEFIRFNRDGEALGMPGLNQVFISVSAAENLGIRVGDTVILRDSDMRPLELEVAGIFENHVQNYAIVLPETVEAQWGQPPQLQMAFVQAEDGADVHTLGAAVAEMENVMNVTVSEDTATQVKQMMDALDLVVVTVVVCAGALAVIVLYNLTNISITERIREIATIKVLGFNAKETAMYVFKENLLLTVMGTVLGLGGGILLLKFVISQIKVDFIWMFASLEPISYVWAVLLTLLSAVVVDFLLYFKLDKINMAEALKSVE